MVPISVIKQCNVLRNPVWTTKSFQLVIWRHKHRAPTVKEELFSRYQVNTINHPQVNKVRKTESEINVMRKKNRQKAEAENEDDMFAFTDLTTLESQMQSLKAKGFLRPYASYSPPHDLLPRFLSLVSSVLGIKVEESSMKEVMLSDKDMKFKVLKALSDEFSHSVPNSMLHQMTSISTVYTFYQSPISSITPYDQLHQDSQNGLLPDNLVIQLNHVRFTGKGDHPMDTVTAWPRRDTVVTSRESKQDGKKAKYSKYQEEDYK